MARQASLSLVQEKGQVTIPASLRRKLGIRKGDYVAFVETADGVVIKRREIMATEVMEKIGALLKEKGTTLDELMESGREIRGEIISERYGLPDSDTK